MPLRLSSVCLVALVSVACSSRESRVEESPPKEPACDRWYEIARQHANAKAEPADPGLELRTRESCEKHLAATQKELGAPARATAEECIRSEAEDVPGLVACVEPIREVWQAAKDGKANEERARLEREFEGAKAEVLRLVAEGKLTGDFSGSLHEGDKVHTDDLARLQALVRLVSDAVIDGTKPVVFRPRPTDLEPDGDTPLGHGIPIDADLAYVNADGRLVLAWTRSRPFVLTADVHFALTDANLPTGLEWWEGAPTKRLLLFVGPEPNHNLLGLCDVELGAELDGVLSFVEKTAAAKDVPILFAAEEWLTLGEWRRRCKTVEARGLEAFNKPTTWKALE